jgi:hypothetical protein
MQDLAPMATARQLTADFYAHLLDHGVVDLALNRARNLLWREAQAGWWVPVLFLRLRNGRLLEQPAGEALAQPAPTYSATLSGDGAIAQDHSTAAGAGGIAIGRIGNR